MHRSVLLSLLVVLAVAPAGVGGVAAQETVDCSYPVSATDATGTNVTLQEEPDKVVITGPSAAQTMWEIGAQDKIVGMPVNQYTAYLNGSESKANVVNSDGQPVREKIVAEDPDLVLAPNITSTDAVDTLRQDGLTVYHFRKAESMQDVSDKTELTGRLVGSFPAAANTSAETRGTLSAVANATQGADEPRVLYDLGFGYTAGPKTFIGDLIATAGGHNIAGDAGIDGYDTISQESIVSEDPEILIINEGAEVPDKPGIQNSTAVEEGNIVRVNPDYLNQPGPRTTEPLVAFAAGFHPDVIDADALRNADPAKPTRCASAVQAEETAAGDNGTATATPGDDGGDSSSAVGPGFGVIAAVLALLGVALLGRR